MFAQSLADDAVSIDGVDYLPVGKPNSYKDYELIYYINDVTIENEVSLVEYGANGTATGTYEYGLQRLSVEYVNEAKEYYLYNGTGNVTQTTAENGSAFLRYTYDPFGNVTSINAPMTVDIDDLNRYTYNGEDYDYNTGLQYLRARYYNTSTGSFILQDTYLGQIVSPLSQNRYTYCHNNPVIFDDPSGHCPYCETTGMGPCSDSFQFEDYTQHDSNLCTNPDCTICNYNNKNIFVSDKTSLEESRNEAELNGHSYSCEEKEAMQIEAFWSSFSLDAGIGYFGFGFEFEFMGIGGSLLANTEPLHIRWDEDGFRFGANTFVDISVELTDFLDLTLYSEDFFNPVKNDIDDESSFEQTSIFSGDFDELLGLDTIELLDVGFGLFFCGSINISFDLKGYYEKLDAIEEGTYEEKYN